MKKIFVLFCAVFLMPTFSAHAWIGGPFSGNTFFGETGTDGIYEAIATAENGIGIYRITVGNEFEGAAAAQLQATGSEPFTAEGNLAQPIGFSDVKSGNAVIGAFGSFWSNVWYYRGEVYRGRTLGTANFVQGAVTGIGEAFSSRVVNPVEQEDIEAVIGTNTTTLPGPPPIVIATEVLLFPPINFPPQDLTPAASLSSSFTAPFRTSGKFVPARSFSGTGSAVLRFADTTAQNTPTPAPREFRFSVFGSKVSDNIFLGL
jgi:hypothetical protein